MMLPVPDRPASVPGPAPGPGRLLSALPGPARATSVWPVAEWSASYTADLASVADSRGDRGAFLGNAKASLMLDLRRLGLRDTHMRFMVLADHGGDPSALAGDIQGLDNIEAPHAVHLYEAWVEHVFDRLDASVLLGFYNLNSEFDVSDAASVFVNSSFGVGADLGESGRRGPSIFPTTSLGLRLRAAPTAHSYAQLAVLDGVPGRVMNGLPHVPWSGSDGMLFVAEGGYLGAEAPDGAGAMLTPAQLRRRRAGLADGDAPADSKLALGAWAYTGRFPAPGAASERLTVRGSYGAYAMGETWLHRRPGAHGQGVQAYVRVGATAGRADPVRFFTGAAVSCTGILQADDVAGLGVAMAVPGAAYRDALRRQNQRPGAAETAVELTWHLGVTGHLSLQPDLQLVLDPLADPARGTAKFAGLRVDVSL